MTEIAFPSNELEIIRPGFSENALVFAQRMSAVHDLLHDDLDTSRPGKTGFVYHGDSVSYALLNTRDRLRYDLNNRRQRRLERRQPGVHGLIDLMTSPEFDEFTTFSRRLGGMAVSTEVDVAANWITGAVAVLASAHIRTLLKRFRSDVLIWKPDGTRSETGIKTYSLESQRERFSEMGERLSIDRSGNVADLNDERTEVLKAFKQGPVGSQYISSERLQWPLKTADSILEQERRRMRKSTQNKTLSAERSPLGAHLLDHANLESFAKLKAIPATSDLYSDLTRGAQVELLSGGRVVILVMPALPKSAAKELVRIIYGGQEDLEGLSKRASEFYNDNPEAQKDTPFDSAMRYLATNLDVLKAVSNGGVNGLKKNWRSLVAHI